MSLRLLKRLHLWAPGIDPNSGGIEKYSNFLYRALREILGKENVCLFTKNDRLGANDCGRITGTGSVPLPMRTATFSALVALRAWRERPDLIISTHLNFSPLARWLKERLGIPYWVSLHGIDAWNLTNESRRRGLREADLLLPVSSYTRDRVAAEQGLPPERFRLLPNAFDASEFKISPKPQYLLKRYDLSAGQPVILTVGRLASSERYKGQDRVLRILSEVRVQMSEVRTTLPADQERPSDLRYVVVGDGDDRPRLEKLAEELGVSDLVIFAGKVPASELVDHYNLCDLFAMPSTGEGFGIVFLEALACGKPVLAGNKDASRDALLDGELGVLVDAEDVQEIARVITAILERKVGSRKSEVESYESGIPRSPIRFSEMMFQPEALRAKVIEHFGYDGFKQRLAAALPDVR